jgi:hypothetical protein
MGKQRKYRASTIIITLVLLLAEAHSASIVLSGNIVTPGVNIDEAVMVKATSHDPINSSI